LVLLARTTIGLEGFKDYFVVPDLGTVKTTLKEDDPRLRRGTKLNDLSQLHDAVARFRRR
jgi:hypothetical protein